MKEILPTIYHLLPTRKKGQSLVEVLVAIAVGALLVIAAAGMIAPALRENKQAGKVQTAAALGKELGDNVRVLADRDWHSIANLATTSATNYYIVASSSPFTAATGTESVTVSTTTYSRYFHLDDVARDSNGNVVTSTSGGSNDPSTKKVTVGYSWPQGATTTYSFYLTRYRNNVYDQTDWSGGSGQSGPTTSTNSQFSTSTSNIVYASTTGSILLALGSGGGGSTSIKTTIASDTFNRADAFPLGSNWSRAINAADDFSISSNQAAVRASGTHTADYWSASSFSDDQFSLATFLNVPTYIGLVLVRAASSTANTYFGGEDPYHLSTGSAYVIGKEVSGSFTMLASSSQTMAINDVVEIDVKGTSLTLIVNGATLLTATDTAITSGAPGIYAKVSVAGQAVMDNWSGGNITTTGGIAKIHFADAANNNVTTYTTITIPSTATGDLLVAYVYAGTDFVNVTSSDGSVFTKAGATWQTTYGKKSAIYFLPNIPAGITSVTMNQISADQGEIYIAEYAGVATANPVDASSSLVQTSSTYSSGNITTSAADDLLFATMEDSNLGGSLTVTPASVWTGLYLSGVGAPNAQDVGAHGNVVEVLQILDAGAAGTKAATGTISSSDLVGTGIVAFKKAP